MKRYLIVILLAASALAGCASHAGRVYAGSPGSTYDANSNPAQTNGTATYDPTMSPKPRDFGNSGDGTRTGIAH